ncbi:MAG: permease prefix domain 1-containing protein [Acidobacteria bacterium]|nr:permease prefix domain 1-containing protein [Acidobacteriota bacterium]
MKEIKNILRNLSLFDRSGAHEHEIEEELRFHLEMRAHDNLASGMTSEEAQADAMRRFGNYEDVKAECRKISKERLEGVMNIKAIKGIIWLMLGAGLALHLAGGFEDDSRAGLGFILIAVIFRLFIFLKEQMVDTVDSKTNKVISWFILGCGLMLRLFGGHHAIMNVGIFLIIIGILWRVLIFLRKIQPDQQRIKTAEQIMICIPGVDTTAPEHYFIEEPLSQVPAHDQKGRTPVERLISDEE